MSSPPPSTGSPAVEPTTFAALAAKYDGVLFDAYGVLVHSGGVIDGAAGALATLERSGKPYLVVTNDASRLPENIAARYARLGLSIPPDRILTAGELLIPYFRRHGLTGCPCVVLGTGDSRAYVERAGGVPVPPDRDAPVVVIADEEGYPFVESVDAALTTVFRRLDAGAELRVVLPNPDLIHPKAGGRFGIGSGSIALVFEAAVRLRYGEERSFRIDRLGKPDPAIFQAAVKRIGTRRVVMIGDQLATDIRGANAAGIDGALVQTGLTRRAAPPRDPRDRPRWILRDLR